MNLGEKILAIRKSRGLTQEQLAEQLNVTRQSVSKWESDQATPELDKIVELSKFFEVSVDYLLQPSEFDELAVKAARLETQQQQMLVRETKRRQILQCGLAAIAVYLLFFALYGLGHFYLGVGNPGVFLAGFLIATAIIILICRHCLAQSPAKTKE